MTQALTITGLGKAFNGRTVLDGIDLSVREGEIVAVLGPSGGGKTTLLRIIAGFESPDTGEVLLRGERVAAAGALGNVHVPPERRRIGIVPQEGALFPHLDVGRNISFGLPRGPEAATRVAEVLDLVGLPGSERLRPEQLSGGQQQRVALARALAPRPSLILLDEPFSSLDAALRVAVRDDVVAVLRAAGTTAVFVTHDQHEALSVADEVAVMIDGRIAQVGEPSALYNSPTSLAVAEFVGEAAVISGESMGDGTAVCALGRITVRGPGANAAGAVAVVVRPEFLSIAGVDSHGEPTSSTASDPALTATVQARSFYGHDGTVQVALADGTSLMVRVQAARLPRVGDRVTLQVTEPLVVFPSA